MKYKLTNVIPVLILLLATEAVTQEQKNLTDWQQRYLEKIQLLAREGGLPEEEWQGITTYNKDVCYEEQCLSAALEIMQATNFSVDPCQPGMLLEFACSRRVNGVDNINQLERLMYKVMQQTINLLDVGMPSGVTGQTFLLKEAQVYYQQCKNTNRHSKADAQEILSFLEENYGEWPILTNRNPGDKFNWLNMVADLNRIERVGFTPLLFDVDVFDTTGHVALVLGKTSFPGAGNDLRKMLLRLEQSSGKNRPVRLDQLTGTNEFLNSLSAVGLMSSKYKIMSIGQLQNLTDHYLQEGKLENIKVEWVDFFQRVLNGSDIDVTSENPQVVLSVNQIMAVLQVVNNHTVSENKTRSISNALNFQFASLLLQESTDLLNDLNSFKCTEQAGAKEDICYDRTTEIFGYSLGKTYLSVYYNREVETPAVFSLMSKIRQGYIDAIESYEWMEEKTRAFIKDKIQSMKTYVAEPAWTKNPKKLKQFYKGLNAATSRNSSYIRNFLAVTSWQVAKKRAWSYKWGHLSSISQINFYDIEWSRYLGHVQAQYHPVINQARIEGGIVQAPLFNAIYPGFMNFGGLGMVLAHELGHSFDTKGRKYNKYGNNNVEWWDKTSVERYNKWVETILVDYGNEAHQISDTSVETVDPVKSINEDIADILGVYISHLSYQEYLQELEMEGKSEKILPGLQKFTPQKLFYMKYINMWCDKKDVQNHFDDLLSVHSSGNTRGTVPLRRSKQFAETFGCPLPKTSFSYRK